MNLDRLKSQLLTSGLQVKDPPLFQVINQLIDEAKSTEKQLNSFITSTTITNINGTSFANVGARISLRC